LHAAGAAAVHTASARAAARGGVEGQVRRRLVGSPAGAGEPVSDMKQLARRRLEHGGPIALEEDELAHGRKWMSLQLILWPA
jgi:hypothetical protein